jgi:hypothetical protein
MSIRQQKKLRQYKTKIELRISFYIPQTIYYYRSTL